MAERYLFTSATHDRPQRRLFVGIAAWFVAALTCIAMAALVGPIGFLVSFFAALFAVPFSIRAFAGERTALACNATLEAGTLSIEALSLAIPTRSIRQGLESGADGSVILDLQKGESLRLRVPANDDSGEKLLSALGVGAGQRVTSVPLRRMLGRFTIGFVTFFFGLIPSALLAVRLAKLMPGVLAGWQFPLMFAFTALLTAAVVARFGAPRVIIGTDGIRILGMLHNPFIPYSEIKSVHKTGYLIVLELVNGKRRELPVVAIDAGRIAGLVRRIERERQRVGTRSLLADSLARGGRSLVDWRSSLAQLARREASFREAPLDRDEVERIATDPSARPEQRIGAAFVLTRIAVDEGKARVRIAAEATADEELREALLAAAEGEMESPAIGRLAQKR